MRRFSSIAALGVVALGVAVFAPFGHAAENFACGPGGKPNPTTAKCDCPPGKVEKTTGGVSHCVAPASPPPTAKPKPSTNASSSLPPVTSSSTTTTLPPILPPPMPTATPETCGDGRTTDAAGHCCWPGQVWGESSGRCRGKPQCPGGLVENNETCVAKCDDGMVRVEGGLHCCWPAQEWSSATHACVGEASCPSGFDPRGDGCARRPPTCEDGKVPADDRHCCWPGQSWSATADGSGACFGTPTCPAPFVARDATCVGPDVIQKEDEEATARAQKEATADASSLGGAGLLRFGLYTAYQRAPSDFNMFVLAYHLGVHLSAIPILIEVGAGGGGYWTTVDAGSASGTVGDLFAALALAPFSYPNAARLTEGTGTSWLNPSVGLEVHRFGFRAGTTSAAVPGLDSTAAGFITFGDDLQFATNKRDDGRGAFVLRLAYGYGVLGNDFARGSRVTLVLSAGAW